MCAHVCMIDSRRRKEMGASIAPGASTVMNHFYNNYFKIYL